MGFGFRDWALGSGRLCPTIRSPQCVFFVFRDAAPRKCGGFREFLSLARFGFCEFTVSSLRRGSVAVGCFAHWELQLVSSSGWFRVGERFPQVYRSLLTVYARATSRVDRKRAPRRSGHQAGASRAGARNRNARRGKGQTGLFPPRRSRESRERAQLQRMVVEWSRDSCSLGPSAPDPWCRALLCY